MSTILITGATGFIGGYILRFFHDKGLNVIAHGSNKKSIKDLKDNLEQENLNFSKIKFWAQNFMAAEWEFPDFEKIDNIIHCAALTKVREGTLDNYENYFKVNVIGTKMLAKKALEEDINHFIYLSTGQVYGIPDQFPITEKTPKNPINLYGATKLMSEIIIKSFGFFGLNYSIVRPFSIYGKGQNNIISIIIKKISNKSLLTIYGDGTQKRSFLHIRDFCKAVHLILGNPTCFQEEFNLAGPKEYSVNKLVNIISKILDKKPLIKYEDSEVNELSRNLADLSKIKNLGFKVREDLEKFLEEEIKNL